MAYRRVHDAVTSRTILLTGATGYVGGQLLPRLLAQGHTVRALVRDASSARDKLPNEDSLKIVEGDVLTGDGLDEAADGADVAYYLVHSMGSGGDDFAQRDRQAATNFAEALTRHDVARTVYLGGLEGGSSEHLRSREEVAKVLADTAPADTVTHVRAAMIVGDRSTSFLMLKGLVEHLPVMLTPRWLDTRTQPIAIDDVTETLAALATRDDAPRELQLGGADVLTYREMVVRTARLQGRRRPLLLRVPLFTPRLSSYWVALFTPVDLATIKPLVEGLSAETVVREAPPAGLNDAPQSFDDAVRAALAG
jgi:uncharacterized protein YbjT (DUF2867 family)